MMFNFVSFKLSTQFVNLSLSIFLTILFSNLLLIFFHSNFGNIAAIWAESGVWHVWGDEGDGQVSLISC